MNEGCESMRVVVVVKSMEEQYSVRILIKVDTEELLYTSPYLEFLQVRDTSAIM